MSDSSNTSSRTSTSWSTSEAPIGAADRLGAWIRLTHPFPSLLDGAVCAGVALVAGADIALALRIGLSMTLLQLAIGTVNDVVDARSDAGRKPGKPIPAGLVGADGARVAAIGLVVAGTLLAATISPTLAVLSLVVVAIGLWYDLRAKGTAWSWLPFAVGIPILPVYGWLGATGSLAPAFALLVPAAVAGGAALAISNSLVDVERDLDAGRSSVAAELGTVRAAGIATALVAGVGAAATATAWLAGATAVALVALLGLGAVALLAAAIGPGRPPTDREWAWRVEAIALGVMAVLWLRAVL